MSISPYDDGPSSRLHRLGPDALSDAELLTLTVERYDPTPCVFDAVEVLARHDGVRGLLRAGVGGLALEVGEAGAVGLIAAIELARRALVVPLARGLPYGSSRDVSRAYGPRLVDLTEECVIAVALDGRQRPAAERVIARGTPARCAVGVREVFGLAVREAAVGLLLVHNHPSGDPAPSPEDITFTRSLAEAGQLLDVPLIDHVIVGREGTFSFLDAGLLREATRR